MRTPRDSSRSSELPLRVDELREQQSSPRSPADDKGGVSTCEARIGSALGEAVSVESGVRVARRMRDAAVIDGRVRASGCRFR